MHKPIIILTTAIFASFTLPAFSANTLTLTDIIRSNGPTFLLPGLGSPPTYTYDGISVPYSTFSFRVSSSGTYTFLSNPSGPAYDIYTALYAGKFKPESSRAGLLITNDDVEGGGSGFSYPLYAGTTYFFVNTVYHEKESGPFSSTIVGPGYVLPMSPMPERRP